MIPPDTIHPPAVAEYLLCIEPRKDLGTAIRDVKQDFSETYKAPDALKGAAQLTLVHYRQYTSFEARISQRLNTLALQVAPLVVGLSDYGAFPAHTIFINVVSRSPIQTLVKNIRTNLQGLMKLNNDNKPHFILEPHIAVARRLKPWQFEQGWLAYRHKTFSGRFIADSMVLLRRTQGAQLYERVDGFAFRNVNIHAAQTALF